MLLGTNPLKNSINATVVGSKQAQSGEQDDKAGEDDEEAKDEEPAKAGLEGGVERSEE